MPQKSELVRAHVAPASKTRFEAVAAEPDQRPTKARREGKVTARLGQDVRRVLEREAQTQNVLAFDFVPPDYYADYPKACMGGWGSAGLNITPDGTVLPCHAAQSIPHLEFANVRDTPLAEIWYDSAAFNTYRGTEWLPEPCQTCKRKEVDFGGCRCQALALTGDADATDPVCQKAPHHHVVSDLLVTAMLEAQTELPPTGKAEPNPGSIPKLFFSPRLPPAT